MYDLGLGTNGNGNLKVVVSVREDVEVARHERQLASLCVESELCASIDTHRVVVARVEQVSCVLSTQVGAGENRLALRWIHGVVWEGENSWAASIRVNILWTSYSQAVWRRTWVQDSDGTISWPRAVAWVVSKLRDHIIAVWVSCKDSLVVSDNLESLRCFVVDYGASQSAEGSSVSESSTELSSWNIIGLMDPAVRLSVTKHVLEVW